MNTEQGISPRRKKMTYVVFIVLSCTFTAELSIIHNKFILNIPITALSFLLPTIAGVLFGYAMARIKLLSEEMKHMAHTDALTSTFNRLHFKLFLESEIEKVKRYEGLFSIIFIDLDSYKSINDQHGHLVGDEVLIEVTKIIANANREADVFARLGGDEFVILTSSTNLEGARIHAERLRQDIERYTFDTVGKLTCSFGVTEFIPESDDIVSLLKRADTALYKAKEKGRNCVATA